MIESAPEFDAQAVALVIRAHPHWTLSQLRHVLGPRLLEQIRVADLWTAKDPVRAQVERESGPTFDACVLRVLREASRPLRASDVRERVGGPRWKLQASLGRLVAAGLVARKGATSATRYWFNGVR